MKIIRDKIFALSSAKKKQLFNTKFYLPENRYNLIDHFIEIEDEYYFYKLCNNRQLINELLGSFFSKQIELDAVQNKIGFDLDKTYILSKSFYKGRCKYYYTDELGVINM